MFHLGPSMLHGDFILSGKEIPNINSTMLYFQTDLIPISKWTHVAISQARDLNGSLSTG